MIEENESPGVTYLQMQADMGITKHLGGTRATERLIEICHLDDGSCLLDVGCGIGSTTTSLAKTRGFGVVGVDLSEKMLGWAKEQARERDVEDLVAFSVADARHLPFEPDTFDAVICESVLAFLSGVEDKEAALGEFVRVTRPGGYVGLNEATWILEPPREMVDFMLGFEGLTFMGPSSWVGMMESCGLCDVKVEIYDSPVKRETVDRIKLLGLRRVLRGYRNLVSEYLRRPEYRGYLHGLARYSLGMPKGLMKYWGYGLYAGRKP